MIFNGVKIEKLLGLPVSTRPNQFYLIETKDGAVEFYLSDSTGTLHLLNEGFTGEIDVNVKDSIGVFPVDDTNVFNNDGATVEVALALPLDADGLEFSFVVLDNSGIVVGLPPGESGYLGDTPIPSGGTVNSTSIGSFLCLRSLEGKWVARYMTGVWNTSDLQLITFNGIPVTFMGEILYE
jgi:hypothetical protein